ncbi:MAG: tRNA pseudouridine(55) synthase TruB [Bacteroidetes bacterium]|nr:MAG: tRNA pseudouridine(55) synthase TruB [Bacteroidota bacterium]
MAFDFVQGEVLLVDKPLEWTSFDVVNFIRSFLRKKYNLKKLKVGHAGTLDPLATGLLIICTGKLTKQIDTFQGMDKVYVGQMKLGATTPSFDKETEEDHQFDLDGISENDLVETAKKFLGEIDQVPPIYSAIKIDGKRAYEHARKKEHREIKPRRVTINEFNLLNINLPLIDFYVKSSKGTYIRSLVRDFGKELNNGAYLTALRRTQIGSFTVNDAYTMDAFKEAVMKETDNYE